MAEVIRRASGGAEAFLRERFGLEWGEDVLGITEDGVTAGSDGTGDVGLMKIEIVARCTRQDVETLVRLLVGAEQKHVSAADYGAVDATETLPGTTGRVGHEKSSPSGKMGTEGEWQ